MSLEGRFWPKVLKGESCWLWTGCRNKYGYGRFNVEGKIRNAHVVSFYLSGRDTPEGMFILHKCDNPPCVNPSHLYAGTKAENTRDSIERLRYHRWFGEKSPVAKISDSKVKELRRLYNLGEKNYSILGKKFGIGRSQVWNIVAGRMRRDCL